MIGDHPIGPSASTPRHSIPSHNNTHSEEDNYLIVFSHRRSTSAEWPEMACCGIPRRSPRANNLYRDYRHRRRRRPTNSSLGLGMAIVAARLSTMSPHARAQVGRGFGVQCRRPTKTRTDDGLTGGKFIDTLIDSFGVSFLAIACDRSVRHMSVPSAAHWLCI